MSQKTVFLRRRPNYTKLPDDLYYEANRKLGASFARGTSDVLRGLTPEEEAKYLPEILGVGVNEPGFRQAKKDFWCDISITVDSGEGTALEVGTDSQGEPINLKDWIDYKFALKHSDVAINEEDLANQFQCKYYLFDPQAKKASDIAEYKQGKIAQTEFLKMSNDKAKMLMVLRLLGFDTRTLSDDINDVELTLKKYVEKTPKLFIEKASDDDLETKSFLEECVSAGVVEKLGNVYLDGDLTLGSSLKEAVVFLKDKVNSKTVTVLKARLEQATA